MNRDVGTAATAFTDDRFFASKTNADFSIFYIGLGTAFRARRDRRRLTVLGGLVSVNLVTRRHDHFRKLLLIKSLATLETLAVGRFGVGVVAVSRMLPAGLIASEALSTIWIWNMRVCSTRGANSSAISISVASS
jgi:hypothetical protein